MTFIIVKIAAQPNTEIKSSFIYSQVFKNPRPTLCACKINTPSLSKHQELVMDREARRAAVHEVAKSWTWLSDWTELIINIQINTELNINILDPLASRKMKT